MTISLHYLPKFYDNSYTVTTESFYNVWVLLIVMTWLFEALHTISTIKKFVVVGNGSQWLTRIHRVELISSVREYENWSARQKNYSAEWPRFLEVWLSLGLQWLYRVHQRFPIRLDGNVKLVQLTKKL